MSEIGKKNYKLGLYTIGFIIMFTFCSLCEKTDSELLLQIVNDAERSGFRVCWLKAEDINNYVHYFQLMLDSYYGTEGSSPNSKKLADGAKYLYLVKSAAKSSYEVKVIYLG